MKEKLNNKEVRASFTLRCFCVAAAQRLTKYSYVTKDYGSGTQQLRVLLWLGSGILLLNAFLM
jgi:hypothetical protein